MAGTSAAPSPGMFVDQVENGRALLMNPDGSTFQVTAGPGMTEGATLPVPGQPGSVPPVPAPVQTAPTPVSPAPVTDPVALAEQNSSQTQQIGQQNVQIAQDKAKLEQDLADKRSAVDREYAQRLEQFHKDQLLARQAADAEIAAKRHALDQQPYHSLWSTRTTGQKAAIALGLLLGGVSWNSNHQNRAVQMLSDAEQEDLQLQKERHQTLWQDLQLSLEGKKELSSQQLHDLSDWQAQESAKWSATASRLNAAIAQNRGRADVSTAQAAALEATEKANTAHLNAINAKATARHLEAQTKLQNEEAKTQPSVRTKNYAEAANQRALAANGGLSKFDQQLVMRIPSILQRDPDLKVLSAKGGPQEKLSQVESMQKAIVDAVNSHDNGAVAAAIAGAREQLTRALSGAAPTKQTAHLVEALQGSPADVESKIGRLLGDPKVGEQFVREIYHLSDDAREQALHEIDQIRERVKKRHQDSRNPLRKSQAAANELDSQIDSYFSGVKSGGGSARYPEGGAGQPQTTPAPQQSYPVGTRATSNGKPIVWDGTQWKPL